jgi:transcriptional regulator with PAS, ATPase and Fis domain
LPPLRERPEDIPLLIEHFYEESCNQLHKALSGFAPSVLDMLSRYSWPGNVRELRSVIRHVCAFAGENEFIRTQHLPPQILSQGR